MSLKPSKRRMPDERGLITELTLSTELAQSLVAAGLEYAATIDRPLTVAVVDLSGQLLSFARMVGAPLATIQTAQDKAWTSVATRRPTHAWADALDSDAALRRGIHAIRGAVPFGGGMPIVVDEQIVGGLGVSGAHYDVDREAAIEILRRTNLAVTE